MIVEVHLSPEQTHVEHRAIVVPFEEGPALFPAGSPVAPHWLHRHSGRPAHPRELAEPVGSGDRPDLPSRSTRRNLRHEHFEEGLEQSVVANQIEHQSARVITTRALFVLFFNTLGVYLSSRVGESFHEPWLQSVEYVRE